MKTDFDKILGKIIYFHSNHREALNREIEKHEKRLHQMLSICSQKKYQRDDIDVRESNKPSLLNNSTENENSRKENISSKVVSKQHLIKKG